MHVHYPLPTPHKVMFYIIYMQNCCVLQIFLKEKCYVSLFYIYLYQCPRSEKGWYCYFALFCFHLNISKSFFRLWSMPVEIWSITFIDRLLHYINGVFVRNLKKSKSFCVSDIYSRVSSVHRWRQYQFYLGLLFWHEYCYHFLSWL